jgi:hypothetical protein
VTFLVKMLRTKFGGSAKLSRRTIGGGIHRIVNLFFRPASYRTISTNVGLVSKLSALWAFAEHLEIKFRVWSID